MRKKSRKKYGSGGPGNHRPFQKDKIKDMTDDITELNIKLDASDGMMDRLIAENQAIGRIIDNHDNKINTILGPAIVALMKRIETLEQSAGLAITPMSNEIRNMYSGGRLKRRRKTRRKRRKRGAGKEEGKNQRNREKYLRAQALAQAKQTAHDAVAIVLDSKANDWRKTHSNWRGWTPLNQSGKSGGTESGSVMSRLMKLHEGSPPLGFPPSIPKKLYPLFMETYNRVLERALKEKADSLPPIPAATNTALIPRVSQIPPPPRSGGKRRKTRRKYGGGGAVKQRRSGRRKTRKQQRV